ncbi:MAG: hypothetical protein RR405_00900 [Clostridia bacterium]
MKKLDLSLKTKKILKASAAIIVATLLALIVFIAVKMTTKPVDRETKSPNIATSGRVTIDSAPLAKVDVYVNGIFTQTTDDFGLFSFDKITPNSIISFVSDFYNFEPSAITVTESNMDIRITATVKDGETIPPDPEVPVDPPIDPIDPPPDPINPPVDPPIKPEKSLLPTKNFAVLQDGKSVYLTFAVDKNCETVQLYCNKMTSFCDISALSTSKTYLWDGKKIDVTKFDSTAIDSKYIEYKIEIQNIFFENGDYLFSATAKAENAKPSQSQTITYAFTCQLLPFLSTLTGTTINWSAVSCNTLAQPNNLRYAIVINGVVVDINNASFYACEQGFCFDFSNFVSANNASFEIYVLAYADNFASSSSNTLTFTKQ